MHWFLSFITFISCVSMFSENDLVRWVIVQNCSNFTTFNFLLELLGIAFNKYTVWQNPFGKIRLYIVMYLFWTEKLRFKLVTFEVLFPIHVKINIFGLILALYNYWVSVTKMSPPLRYVLHVFKSNTRLQLHDFNDPVARTKHWSFSFCIIECEAVVASIYFGDLFGQIATFIRAHVCIPLL